MKVYFVGAQSVGKTTLARYVSEKYNLPLLTEVARLVLAEKELNLDSLRTNLSVVNDYQSDIFFRQFEEEKKHETFVSDRSFDNLAYTAQHSTVFGKLVKDSKLLDYISELKQPGTILFFVRPSLATMKNDGIRENVKWDAIVSIDAMIKMLLEWFELNYVVIASESMQERAKTIDTVLSLLKNK